MSAVEVKDELLRAIDEDKYDFIVLNFANPDMVGHTGIMTAAVKAVETVDNCLGEIVDKLVSLDGKIIITADHGNAEEMVDANGNATTAHSTNPVPCIVIGEEGKLREDGKLSDLAPTLLEMLGLQKPEEMTGSSIVIK